jgi:hypothetical protein
VNNNKLRGFKVLIIFGHEKIPTSENFDHMCVGLTLMMNFKIQSSKSLDDFVCMMI